MQRIIKPFLIIFTTKPFLLALTLLSGIAGVLATPSWFKILAFSILVILFSIQLIFYWFPAWRVYGRRTGVSMELLQKATTHCFIERATAEEVSWIANIEVEKYDDDAVPEQTLRDWYSVNPNGFFIIKVGGGTKIGHLDILPIRPHTLQKFIAGQMVEKAILGDALYTPEERDKINNLYVESIIIDPPKDCSRYVAIRTLLLNIDSLVQEICPPEQVDKVYAVAATGKGAGFMKGLGFSVLVPAAEREDRLDLYCVPFKALKAEIEKRIEKR